MLKYFSYLLIIFCLIFTLPFLTHAQDVENGGGVSTFGNLVPVRPDNNDESTDTGAEDTGAEDTGAEDTEAEGAEVKEYTESPFFVLIPYEGTVIITDSTGKIIRAADNEVTDEIERDSKDLIEKLQPFMDCGGGQVQNKDIPCCDAPDPIDCWGTKLPPCK